MPDPVDPKAFLTLVELAIGNMYELEAIGESANHIESTGLQDSEDYKNHCDAIIKVYEMVLGEDNNTAANGLRYMFSP